MKNIRRMNEWLLAIKFRQAMDEEDFEACAEIQAEVNRRIENGTLDKYLMEGFKKYNHLTGEFYGDPNLEGLNGLFDKYYKNR